MYGFGSYGWGPGESNAGEVSQMYQKLTFAVSTIVRFEVTSSVEFKVV